MASRIMHLVIGEKLIEKLKIKDRHAFIYGNFAPDLSKYRQMDYGRAHFAYADDQVKGINFKNFEDMYEKHLQEDDFYRGYLCHLITDAIWVKHIQQAYVRHDRSNKHVLYKKGYEDMKAYNPYLINYFKLKPYKGTSQGRGLDLFDERDYTCLLEDLAGDFMIQEDSTYEFQVYPPGPILHFISHTIEVLSAYLGRNKTTTLCPRDYYVVNQDEMKE